MVHYIFVKHRTAGNFTSLKLIDLVSNQMHRVNLSVNGGLRFGNLITEAKEWIFVKGPTSTALETAIVDDD